MPTKKLATKLPGLDHGHNARVENPGRDGCETRIKSSSCVVGPPPSRTPRRKRSEHIGARCARDVFAALAHAAHINCTPARFLSINWEAAGVTDPIWATGQLMKLMRDSARRHGLCLTYIWVREWGPTIGERVHIMFHLPAKLAKWFKKNKPGWLKRCGANRGKGISNTAISRGSSSSAYPHLGSRELYDVNLRRVTDYVLKHCSAEVQDALGIRTKGPCPLDGKRVSISQNLHRLARQSCVACQADHMDKIADYSNNTLSAWGGRSDGGGRIINPHVVLSKQNARDLNILFINSLWLYTLGCFVGEWKPR